jgi:hypothetical protein
VSRRRRPRSAAVAAAVLVALAVVAGTLPGTADAREDLDGAVAAWSSAVDRREAAEREVEVARLGAEEARAQADAAQARLARAGEQVARDRSLAATAGIQRYLHEADDQLLAKGILRATVDDRLRELASAQAARRRAERRADEARVRSSSAEDELARRQADLDEAAVAEDGAREGADAATARAGAPDLGVVGLDAYRSGATAGVPCSVPGALLAGLGLVDVDHGQAGALPRSAMRAWAAGQVALLCAAGGALDTDAALRAALADQGRDGAQIEAVLAAARRYASVAALGLGVLPPDPRLALVAVEPSFEAEGATLPAGDVAAMVGWATTRLGTPYSQCLGIEARPQDPVCPPGADRFGRGFFDCSGFVSMAYARIGVSVPTTTYAMEADPAFMATKVASGVDVAAMLPGDVLLMAGHTGLYVGEGLMVHAIGAGLTLEPIPAWVARATFAVLRPVPPPPPPLPEPPSGDLAAAPTSSEPNEVG